MMIGTLVDAYLKDADPDYMQTKEQAIAELQEWDIVTVDKNIPTITQKGKALLSMFAFTPNPRPGFFDPRNGKAVDSTY